MLPAIPRAAWLAPVAGVRIVFLVGLPKVYEFYRAHGASPTDSGVALPENAELLPASHIAEDTPGVFGGWIIHKENFRARKILEVARLQEWTLKPAVRVGDK